MTAYILVLVLGVANSQAMTSVSGFRERSSCESAGEAWKVEAKDEFRVRYFCVVAERLR